MKVKKGLEILGVDETSMQPYLLELLSVKDSGIYKIKISSEEKKNRFNEALKRIVFKSSEIRPLVMAIEDLHWIDKSSEEVIKELIESISGSRVFLILTYRPQYVNTWGTWTYHSQLNLNRFSNRECLLMVRHSLGTKIIEKTLEKLILEKSEGVPFFIEEFIRSLKNLCLIERKSNAYRLVKDLGEIKIPNTIHDVIMARVDSLPESAKTVLVTGSVIEREFNHSLLKSVIGGSEQDLLTSLSVLKDVELIYERGLYPHSTYIFKHALTREVVYDSIVNSKRKGLHEKIGQTIEQLYQENIQEHYGVLVAHYIRSENYSKGAEYSKYASKKAFGSASFSEAIGHVRNLIFCLERLPLSESNQKRIIKARTALAMYLINITQLEGLLDAVAPIENMAVALNSRKMLARIYIALGIYYYATKENIQKGEKYIEDASHLSAISEDYLSAYYAFLYLGITFTWRCEFSKAQLNFNKCMELSSAVNNPIGISHPKALASYAYCYQGIIEKAFRLAKEGLEEAEQSGYLFNRAPAYTSYGISCYYKGFFNEGEKYMLLGADCSKKISQFGWEHWACVNLGNLYLDIGEFTRAEDTLTKSLMILKHAKILPSWGYNCRVALAKVRVLDNPRNLNLNELTACFENNSFKVNRGYIARNIGEVLLTIGKENITDAESWIQKAIENDHKYNVRWSLANDYTAFGKLLLLKGERTKADENLQKSVNTLKVVELRAA